MPRVSDSNLKTYRITSALEGSFQWADRYFDWDAGFLHNENNQRQVTYGNLNTVNAQAGVGPSFLNAQGQVQCGTAAAPISFNSCVPFNPFAPYGSTGPGALTGNAALMNFLYQPEVAYGETKTQVFSANMSTTLFTLPAGDIGFAFGVERREESGKFNPDPMAVAGVTTNLSSGPTKGEYSVNEAYAEFEIPLLADMQFAKELSLNVASRYSDYDTFGDTTNNKIAMKWRPIESLLLRASANDGFRAPTIADLYGGGSQTFSFFTDPCDTNFGSSKAGTATRANCVSGPAGFGPAANTYRQLGQGLQPVNTSNSQTPVAFTSGSNPLLVPEVSKSQTMGFVWSPGEDKLCRGAERGCRLVEDPHRRHDRGGLPDRDPQRLLHPGHCQPVFAELFTRDPAQGYVNFMSFGNRNAGFRKVEGFDVDVSYRFKTDVGDFSVVSNSTYTASDYFLSTNDPRVPLSNVGFTSSFRIRSNLNVGWEWGDFGVSWMARYYSSMKEPCTYVVSNSIEPNLECNEITYAPTGAFAADGVTPASAISRRKRTGSVTFNDLQFRWSAPWDATVSVGANNIFEKYGPVMYSQPSANVSYYGGFDIGRFWYLKYTQRF